MVRGFLSVLVAMPVFADEYARIKSFDAFPAGGPLVPSGGLIEGSDGALYGTSLLGGAFLQGTVYVLKKDGSGCRVLHSFGDGLHFGIDEGASPKAALIEGSDGALYGTTASGGRNKQGTLFAINKDGSNYRLLYMFSGLALYNDGANPAAALVEGRDGELYGTTMAGGGVNQGTIFRISKDGGGYRTLHAFNSATGDGSTPRAALMEASDGAFYGTTVSGGSLNRGTIYKINKDGSDYTVLYRFASGGNTGANPSASVIEGRDGSLYGTTSNGGTGSGTVFKIKKDGSGHTVLHSFTGGRAHPEAALVEGPDGALYGTTPGIGSVGWGAVFKVQKDGTGFQIVHTFAAAAGEGRGPGAALLAASDGALYSTTAEGGNVNQGIVFKIRTPDFQLPATNAVRTAQSETVAPQPREVKSGAAEAPSWPVPRVVPTSAPDKLMLKGISGAGNRRFALVNNQTLAVGDRAKVRVGTSNVVVQCVEIREGSVIVKVEGDSQTRELVLTAQ